MKPGKDNQKDIQVSIVICAYNEEKYVKTTIRDALKCPTADEVIVVDDGSTDKTKQVAQKFGKKIKLISYKNNMGKGYAFSKGVKAAKGKIIVMLDADLKNLRERHLRKMTEPILKRETNYVLAYPNKKNTPVFLTGQRAYLRDLLIPYLSQLKKSRWGLEAHLNDIYKTKWGKAIKLKDLSYYSKIEKSSPNEALNQYLQEIVEISKTKAIIQLENYVQVKRLVNSKEIKSLKKFRDRLGKVMDKEVSELIDDYILPYLKKDGRNDS